tara:strand:- start:6256 stop:6939 length:684 start_codon:yes stop_codon:yes gene_type:complete
MTSPTLFRTSEVAPALQKPKKNVKPLPEYYSPQQIKTVITNAPIKKTEVRQYSVMAELAMLFMWRSGLRIAEVRTLRESDISRDRLPENTEFAQKGITEIYNVRVLGKGGKERIVPMHPELADYFVTYCQIKDIKKGANLFENPRTGKLYTRQAIYDWVKKAQKNSGILETESFSPHTLRHSYARHMLFNGVKINTLQLWLGHAQLSTTLIYLKLVPDPDNQILEIE